MKRKKFGVWKYNLPFHVLENHFSVKGEEKHTQITYLNEKEWSIQKTARWLALGSSI